MTGTRPPIVLQRQDRSDSVLAEMARIVDHFADAVAAPDRRDALGRNHETKLDRCAGTELHWDRIHVLNHRSVDPRAVLTHPMGEGDDDDAPAMIAAAIQTHDEAVSIANHRRVDALLGSLAHVVGIARPPALHNEIARRIRVRLPTPWQPLLVTDVNGKPILTDEGLARLAPHVPTLCSISHRAAILPGHKRRTEEVHVRHCTYGTTGIQVDDVVDAMRRAAFAPITPDDVIPLPKPTRKPR